MELYKKYRSQMNKTKYTFSLYSIHFVKCKVFASENITNAIVTINFKNKYQSKYFLEVLNSKFFREVCFYPGRIQKIQKSPKINIVFNRLEHMG